MCRQILIQHKKILGKLFNNVGNIGGSLLILKSVPSCELIWGCH